MAVIQSNDSDIQATLNSNERVIIKFYAEWCGSCKLIAPKYKRLSNDEQYSSIIFLEVDAENNPTARKLANVNTLPYFATFKNGKLINEVSTSKEEGIVNLLNEL